MKVLRVLGSILLSFVLLVLLLILPLSFIVQDIIQNNLVGAAVKEVIKEGVDKSADSDLSDKQKKELEELFEDERVSYFFNVILDKYADYKDTGKFEIDDKEYDKFIEYIEDHEKDLEDLTGEEVNSEYIKEKLSKEDINKAFNDMFKDMDKELDGNKTASDIIVGFSKFISTSFRITIIIGILIIIGLLMLINWSFIKWMIPTGVTSIIASINILLVFGILKVVQGQVSSSDSSADILREMNFNSVLYIGLGMFILGIVLIILYNVFKKKKVENPV